MGRLLERINGPSDLRHLSEKETNRLLQEIRQYLIANVSQTGGHLAPNLGVVELTVALHTVFSSPEDKIVWDVGHQSYVHKLLTGRYQHFSTLRQYGGISGFPKRKESEHDIFDTGHSSTSISVALGIAKARDIKGEKNKVLAIIGDGSLTGGLALEGLNQAGDLGTDLTVILNDNEMSISHNVGALAAYLNRIRVDPTYFKVKRDVEYLLSRVPAIGETMVKVVERVKDSLKYLLVSGILFEELGFTYLGPIDGHNLSLLKRTLENTKKIKGPILVHVITKKGKGYLPAEKNPDKFHGIAPFNIEDGEIKKKSTLPSFTQIFGQTLLTLAQKNEKIVAITAAMPDGTGLKPFANNFPERFFDVGIAEQHAVTFAAGMANEGFKPVVAIYSTFFQRAYDQILHDVCLQDLGVIFALDRAGLVGEDGPTHHGVFDLSYLRHMPNLVIMAPKDENELQHMLQTAVEYYGPIALRYPRGRSQGIFLDKEWNTLPIGKGEILCTGSHLSILAVGTMVYPALEAAKILKKEKGIEATVVNMRFVKPLDEALVSDLAKQTERILTIEENVLIGGLGSAVLEMMEEKGICAQVKRLGLPDNFIQHGQVDILLAEYHLTAKEIAKVAEAFCLEGVKSDG